MCRQCIEDVATPRARDCYHTRPSYPTQAFDREDSAHVDVTLLCISFLWARCVNWGNLSVYARNSIDGGLTVNINSRVSTLLPSGGFMFRQC